MKPSLPFVVFLFCCAIFLALFSSLPHAIWHPAVVLGWFVSKGLVFYRDFTNHHFPLATFLALPFLWISGWNLQIEPFLSLIIAVATLFLLFKISIKLFSWTGTTTCLIFFTALFYYFSTSIQYSMEAVIGLFLTFLLLLFVRQIGRSPTRSEVFKAGVIAGITQATGQIVVLSLATLCLGILHSAALKAKKIIRIEIILYFLVGGILPLSILSFYLIVNKAFSHFFDTNIVYYLAYWKLTRASSKLSDLPWTDIIFFYLPLTASLLLLVKGFATQKTKKMLTTIFLASLASIPSIIFSIFHPHHFLYILPAVALLSGFIGQATGAKQAWVKVAAFFLILSQLWFMANRVLPWYQSRSKLRRPYIVNDVMPGDPMYDAVSWINTNTKPESRILVAGDMLFYFKSDRLPSANRQTVLPWHYKPIEQTAVIVTANRPDYWIVDTNYLKRLTSPDQWNSPEITEFITEELKNCYRQTAIFAQWQIWQKTKC